MKTNLPTFLQKLAPWERRFSCKYRVELVHRMNEVLAEKNLTQKEVAVRAGWKEPYLSRILGGEQNLTLKTIARFEEAVGEDVLTIPLPMGPTFETNPRTNTTVFEREHHERAKPDIDMKAILKGVEAERNTASEQGHHSIFFERSLHKNDEEMADVG